ncbi:10 TM acyl transferase domain found in Cas1p-domain-containing protein [Dipodascopsis tothii]|uniref:10 TM acyl transferase domain found in Cas1p-domain-containing protein n=1 Tax=Dipodascopsis tothii TaxID=44089 RepID=UPI0034CD8A7B
MGWLSALSSFSPSADHVSRSVVLYMFFVAILAIGRYAYIDVFDPYHCGALAGRGQWLDTYSGAPLKNWQPDGCMMHAYKPKEVEQCLGSQHVVFAGDSSVRQIFWATVKTIDPTVEETKKKHSNVNFEHGDVKIDFIWDPFLNSTAMDMVSKCATKDEQDKRGPNAYLVLGSGLWHARYLGEDGATLWKDNTEAILKAVRACPDYYRMAVYNPVTIPDRARMSKERGETISDTEISYMNSYLAWAAAEQSNVIVPGAFAEMSRFPTAIDNSGIHVIPSVAAVQATVLLNLRCNQQLVASKGYPYDKTCCSAYPTPTVVQVLTLGLTFVVLPYLFLRSAGVLRGSKLTWLRQTIDYTSTQLSPNKPNAVVAALFVFMSIVTYAYLADRTRLFNKSAKQYFTGDFVLLTTMAVLAGAFTIRKSSSEQGFMGRDQSNEWKGWMQIMVLIYHITGASKVLPIYKIIRVMVAAYLFMTGYGHTIFFYKKRDFSLKRVANVLVRLNLLSVVLAYSMNTDYLFYYFAPLSSFWFLVVYATMYVLSSMNEDTPFLIAKIVFSAGFVNIIVSSKGPLDALWFVLQRLCFITWDLREWRFRVLLDCWIVYVGMLAALVSIKLQDSGYMRTPAWPRLRVAALIASVAALVAYQIMSQVWNVKQEYTKHHPVIAFLPIIGFLLLRNATHPLRNYYSTAFAWVGTCSLETFTLQFHIWMAADTHGLLEVLPSRHRVLNFVILTPLFLYLSSLTCDATGTLTGYIVSGPKTARPAPRPVAPAPPAEDPEKAAQAEREATAEPAVQPDRIDELPTTNAPPPPPPSTGIAARLTGDLRLRLLAIFAAMWATNVAMGIAKSL